MRDLYADLDAEAYVTGFGSVFVTYFMPPEPPRNYTDLLRHDAELFVGYRRRLLNHGMFELPLNLKRSHVSYAHTTGHVDRLLGATRKAVHDELAGRRP